MTRTHSMRKLPFWRRQFLPITFYFLFPSILLADAASTNEETSLPLLEFAPLDYLLIILSSALVFLMQAGFKCFEVGMLRQKHSVTIGMKNIIDYIVVAIGYFLVGFALMFGSSQGGMFGTSFFALEGINSSGSGFFLFQLAFAATSVTIVSGAMAERTGFMTYLIASVCVGTLIYPVVGHWVWGGIYITEGNAGWLQKLGFYDFAGATVVHGTGAWVALIGVWMLGPRLGRYDTVTGKFNTFEGYNLPYAILGVIILWLGWWGFNGGSTLAVEKDGKMLLGDVILNTSLAAAGGGLAGFFHSFFFQAKADINEKLLGSILGGLVAITASASIMSPVFAILIGLVAGVLHNYSYDLILKKLRLDDSIAALPVHGVCGVFGTICVSFGDGMNFLQQLPIQLLGIAVVFLWSTIAAFVVFSILKRTVGLRVSAAEEHSGINISGTIMYPEIKPSDNS